MSSRRRDTDAGLPAIMPGDSIARPNIRANPCIVIVQGVDQGRKFALLEERTLLGRVESAQIRVDDDTISREHCAFELTDGAVFVRDLGSANGTLVNARRATHQKLSEGDRIYVGRSALKFLQPGSAEHDYHDQVYEQHTRDELTGLRNRRYFEHRLADLLRLGDDSLDDAALMMVDVDRFNDINDRFDARRGDEVLIQVANNLLRVLPNSPIIARWGGARFTVLIPPRSSADQLAEQLRQLCEKIVVAQGEQSVPVTVSIGVAGRPATQAVDPQGHLWIQRMLEQLHLARQRGNRVCSWFDSLATSLSDLTEGSESIDLEAVATLTLRAQEALSQEEFCNLLTMQRRGSKGGRFLIVGAASVRNRVALGADLGNRMLEVCDQALVRTLRETIEGAPVAFIDGIAFYVVRSDNFTIVEDLQERVTGTFSARMSYKAIAPESLGLSFGSVVADGGTAAEELMSRAYADLRQKELTDVNALPFPIARSVELVQIAEDEIEMAWAIAGGLERSLRFLAHLALGRLLDPDIWEDAGYDMHAWLKRTLTGGELSVGECYETFLTVSQLARTRDWPVLSALAEKLFPDGRPSDAMRAAGELNKRHLAFVGPNLPLEDRQVRAEWRAFVSGLQVFEDYRLCTLTHIKVRAGLPLWNVRDHSGPDPMFAAVQLQRSQLVDTDETYLVHRKEEACMRLSPLMVLGESDTRGKRGLFWTESFKLNPTKIYTPVFSGEPQECDVEDIDDLPDVFVERRSGRRNTQLIKATEV